MRTPTKAMVIMLMISTHACNSELNLKLQLLSFNYSAICQVVAPSTSTEKSVGEWRSWSSFLQVLDVSIS